MPVSLKARLTQIADYYAAIRAFFAEREVLEVSTPALAPTGVTDPYLVSLPCVSQSKAQLFLQTSPEYAMKRLLAAGSGCIYQFSKAFRDEEQGRHHALEFTLLEWYRVGFTHEQLMMELDTLLQTVFAAPSALRLSYAALFQQHLAIDPHRCSLLELQQAVAKQASLQDAARIGGDDRDMYLQLLMTEVLEPKLARFEQPVFVYHYPASQAALAKITDDQPPVAERFELYWRGVELANGYHELTCPVEQRQRFEADNARRRQLGLFEMALDEALLAAMQAPGLPACAGVALGMDRLLMLAFGLEAISELTVL